MGFPGGSAGKESACNVEELRKIPWRREQLPTPVFWPGEPHGLQPVRLLCPWGFSRQEYWSGLPCPPPGDLANPGSRFK